jgi:hypothetical protein
VNLPSLLRLLWWKALPALQKPRRHHHRPLARLAQHCQCRRLQLLWPRAWPREGLLLWSERPDLGKQFPHQTSYVGNQCCVFQGKFRGTRDFFVFSGKSLVPLILRLGLAHGYQPGLILFLLFPALSTLPALHLPSLFANPFHLRPSCLPLAVPSNPTFPSPTC